MAQDQAVGNVSDIRNDAICITTSSIQALPRCPDLVRKGPDSIRRVGPSAEEHRIQAFLSLALGGLCQACPPAYWIWSIWGRR